MSEPIPRGQDMVWYAQPWLILLTCVITTGLMKSVLWWLVMYSMWRLNKTKIGQNWDLVETKMSYNEM